VLADEDEVVLPISRPPPSPLHPIPLDVETVEDDTATVSTEDPVGLAMNAILEDVEQTEEEQVLYPQQSSASPQLYVVLTIVSLRC
jgi:hypothetical protein